MLRTTARMWVAGALAVGAALASTPTASAEPGEEITFYDVAVTITTDGHAHVTETIAYDFHDHLRHGITRTLPGHTLTGTATATSPDGAPSTTTTSGNSIRVGDPASTVTGAHTYVLNYDVLAGLTPAGPNASVGWDVLDGSWDVPISSVTATITAPAAATLSSCSLSGTGSCSAGVATTTGNVIHIHQSAIWSHQTMTVAATFPADGVTLPSTSALPSYTYTPLYTTAPNTAYSSSGSSNGSSAIGWLIGLGVVGIVGIAMAQAAAKGSGRSRRSSSWSNSSSYSSYSSSSDSGSSYTSSSDSGSSSSDSGSSSSSCGSGSW